MLENKYAGQHGLGARMLEAGNENGKECGRWGCFFACIVVAVCEKNNLGDEVLTGKALNEIYFSAISGKAMRSDLNPVDNRNPSSWWRFFITSPLGVYNIADKVLNNGGNQAKNYYKLSALRLLPNPEASVTAEIPTKSGSHFLAVNNKGEVIYNPDPRLISLERTSFRAII